MNDETKTLATETPTDDLTNFLDSQTIENGIAVAPNELQHPFSIATKVLTRDYFDKLLNAELLYGVEFSGLRTGFILEDGRELDIQITVKQTGRTVKQTGSNNASISSKENKMTTASKKPVKKASKKAAKKVTKKVTKKAAKKK